MNAGKKNYWQYIGNNEMEILKNPKRFEKKNELEKFLCTVSIG